MNFESGVPNPWRAEARAKFLASLETLKAKTIDEGVAGIGDIESPSYGLSAGADPVQVSIGCYLTVAILCLTLMCPHQAIDQAIQKLHQETQQTSRKAQSILRELERTEM